MYVDAGMIEGVRQLSIRILHKGPGNASERISKFNEEMNRFMTTYRANQKFATSTVFAELAQKKVAKVEREGHETIRSDVPAWYCED